jgi:hypothetical protein
MIQAQVGEMPHSQHNRYFLSNTKFDGGFQSPLFTDGPAPQGISGTRQEPLVAHYRVNAGICH